METQFGSLHRFLTLTQPLDLNIIDGNAILRVVFRLRIKIHRNISNITIFLRYDKGLFSLRVKFEVEPFQIGNIFLFTLVDPFPTDYSEQVLQRYQRQNKVLYLFNNVNFL